jgi:hypothetical protein
MGVTDCDNMLMILGVSQKMTDKERDTVVPIIMKGFRVRIHKFLFNFSFSFIKLFLLLKILIKINGKNLSIGLCL